MTASASAEEDVDVSIIWANYTLNLKTLKDDINTSFVADASDRNLFDDCLLLHGLQYVSHRTIDLRSTVIPSGINVTLKPRS